MIDDIVYLIKFVEKEEYANDLLKGNLYFNSSVYYNYLFYQEYYNQYKKYDKETFENFCKTYEGPIGDVRENLVLGCIYIASNYSFFSFYKIKNEDIEKEDDKEKILINSKMIKEFKKNKYKYFIIIKFDYFKKLLENYKLEIGYGEINYNKNDYTDAQLICDKNNKKNLLFCKYPQFSYQKEFRIILNPTMPNGIVFPEYNCRLEDRNKIFNKNKEEIKNNFGRIWNIGDLSNFSKKHSIEELTEEKGDFYSLTIE